MSEFYCPRCATKDVDIYCKAVTTPASGPFIVGHIGGDPNLPMIGGRLNAGTSRLAYFCKTCGEEAREVLTPEERKNKEENELYARNVSVTLTIIIVAVFIISIIGIIINHDAERRADKARGEAIPGYTPAIEVSPTPTAGVSPTPGDREVERKMLESRAVHSGDIITLTQSVSFPFGVLTVGNAVQFVSDEGSDVRIRHGGTAEYLIPISATDLKRVDDDLLIR